MALDAAPKKEGGGGATVMLSPIHSEVGRRGLVYQYNVARIASGQCSTSKEGEGRGLLQEGDKVMTQCGDNADRIVSGMCDQATSPHRVGGRGKGSRCVWGEGGGVGASGLDYTADDKTCRTSLRHHIVLINYFIYHNHRLLWWWSLSAVKQHECRYRSFYFAIFTNCTVLSPLDGRAHTGSNNI